MTSDVEIDLGRLKTRELLRLTARVLTELNHRRIIRSRNAPAGDLAEYLVAKAYEGELAPKSEKSWDVLASGARLQVKCRLVDPSKKRTQFFSPFRSWDFEACVFVVFDCFTYDVVSGVEMDVSVVKELSQEVRWVNGHRVSVGQVARNTRAGRDVTLLLDRCLTSIDG